MEKKNIIGLNDSHTQFILIMDAFAAIHNFSVEKNHIHSSILSYINDRAKEWIKFAMILLIEYLQSRVEDSVMQLNPVIDSWEATNFREF